MTIFNHSRLNINWVDSNDSLLIIDGSNISSNDVVGLQDLYLQLDIGKSHFEMIIDEIASGLDPSGSNYITSTSYANGNLVRAGGRTSATTPVGTSAPTTTTSSTTSSSSSTSTSAASSY